MRFSAPTATILGLWQASRDVASPAGELLTLARSLPGRADHAGDLGQQLRSRGRALVPPVCPPGLQEVKPTLDDLELWAAGSFDELVLVCELDILRRGLCGPARSNHAMIGRRRTAKPCEAQQSGGWLIVCCQPGAQS